VVEKITMTHLPPSVREAKLVYHFTDTARLPWIIESGELQPGKNRIGGYPPDFLWATSSQYGDRTSSASSEQALKLWRGGATQLIRFTLDANDFVDWRDLVNREPAWTPHHIAQLEAAAIALGQKNTNSWCCRVTPLPLARALRIEAKSHARGRWITVNASASFCVEFGGMSASRGFVIDGQAYCATRQVSPCGNYSFDSFCRIGVKRAA
jgi:hypothetical protein